MSESRNASSDETAVVEVAPRRLLCQWCTAPLPAGATICRTCGSPGIPDPTMTVAGLTDFGERSPDPLAEAVVERGATGDQSELIEWWHGDEQKGDTREPLSFEEVEQRRMLTLAFIGIAVVFCASLGWIIGPAMLDGPIESLTGTPVEEPSDLRGLGTFVGLIAGMFIGASGGWVIWSTR